MELEIQEIVTKNGTWQVLKRGNEICIVDSEGRERHRSKGHVMTAVCYAMALSENKFNSLSNLDEALRMSAQQFKDK